MIRLSLIDESTRAVYRDEEFIAYVTTRPGATSMWTCGEGPFRVQRDSAEQTAAAYLNAIRHEAVGEPRPAIDPGFGVHDDVFAPDTSWSHVTEEAPKNTLLDLLWPPYPKAGWPEQQHLGYVGRQDQREWLNEKKMVMILGPVFWRVHEQTGG